MQTFFYNLTLALLGLIIISLGSAVRKLKKDLYSMQMLLFKMNEMLNHFAYENAQKFKKSLSGKEHLTPDEEEMLTKANIIINKHEALYNQK